MKFRYITHCALAALLAMATACSDNTPDNPSDSDPTPELPPEVSGGEGISANDGDMPLDNGSLSSWNGITATDAAADKAGTDVDLFHEANTFTNIVTVKYNGSEATAVSSNPSIAIHTDGAYVAIDFQSGDVSGVEIHLSGSTTDGGLKIYGNSKFMLTLDGAHIESQRGPAVNSQCRKRMFLHLTDGTKNELADAPVYTDDHFYRFGYNATNEDRKGCLFTEGHLIVSGHGSLEVKGRQRHGVATDGYMYIRPGVTLAVTEAAKNSVHVKGDVTDGIGFRMDGGMLYANNDADAGKCIKTDLDITVNGGMIRLYSTGNAIYDTSDADTSSAAGLKADRNITLYSGKIEIFSSGDGSKGINATGRLTLSGADLTVCDTAGRFTDDAGHSAAARGIKSDDGITITGGKINVYASGDAMKAPEVTISGGNVTAYSGTADGIDADRILSISGGTVMASGGNTPESGLDCESADGFMITGGTVFAIGGALQNTPSAMSSQTATIITDVTASKGEDLVLYNTDGQAALTINMPRSVEGAVLLVSAPGLSGPLTTE